MRFSSLISAVLSFAAVVCAQQAAGQNAFTFPLGGTLDSSAPLTIKWTPTTKGTITIKLLRGPPTNILDISVVAASIENTGTFVWTIPSTLQGSSTLPAGERYGFKILDDLTSTFEYSPPFDITVAPAAGSASVSSVSTSASTSSSTSLSTSESSTGLPSAVSTSSPSVAPTGLTTTAVTSESTGISSPAPAPTVTPTETTTQSLQQTTLTTSTRTNSPANTQTAQSDNQESKTGTSSSGPNVGLIAGVVGGVVGLALAALVIVLLIRRKNQRNRESAHIPMRERGSIITGDGAYNKVGQDD